MNLKELRRKAEAANKGGTAKYFLTMLGTGTSKEQREIDAAYMTAANPVIVLALLDQIEAYEKALKHYENFIPVHRVISEESAAWEREYGVGRVAQEVLKRFEGE